MIKCISFDLWGTLIKGNPIYKAARAELVSKFVDDHTRFSTKNINSVFETVKRDFDNVTENYGVQFKSRDLYTHIFEALEIPRELHDQIISQLASLFVSYPPMVIDGTIPAIEKLSQKYAIVLVSNTLLVDGYILEVALRPSGLWDNFNYLCFSSDVGHAKPSRLIFNAAFNFLDVKASEVVHVGDNVNTDGLGITRVGGTFRHINGSSGKTITDVEVEYGNSILS